MTKVKSLKDCALKSLFNSVFNSLTSRLSQNLDETETNKGLAPVAESRSASGKWTIKPKMKDPRPRKKRRINPEEVVESIRGNLNDFLVGTYSEVRQKLVAHFAAAYFSSEGHPLYDYHLCMYFFDCTMDTNFKKFVLPGRKNQRICFPNPTEMLQVVFKRCPKLLNLDFQFSLSPRSPPVDSKFGLMLGMFKNLTHLTISWETLNDCLDFFSSLGQCCCLASLDLAKIPFSVDQVLAMILGKKQKLLTPHFSLQSHSQLRNLQFSPESLSPICKSLRYLFYSCIESTATCYQSLPIGLPLRHFRKLYKWENNKKKCRHRHERENSTAQVVKAWHQNLSNVDEREISTTVTTTRSSNELGTIQWTTNAPFSNPLFLMKIVGVALESRITMQAVTSLCPHLREVEFVSNLLSLNDDILYSEELRSLLTNTTGSCWTKDLQLRKVTFSFVKPNHRQTFLSILGHQMQSLSFIYSEEIDILMELEHCKRLRSLTLWSGSQLLSIEPTDLPSADAFLPHLRKLATRFCLGGCSHLFENHRPSLKQLNLNCLHFGVPTASDLNWSQVPKMWPNLVILDIASCTNLTYETLRQLIPRWEKLQTLVLPESMNRSSAQKEMAREFIVQQNRCNNIQISFNDFVPESHQCLFLPS